MLQNFYFRVIENSLQKYDDSQLKNIDDKQIHELSLECYQIKKKIFKRVLLNLNYPNRKIDLELKTMDKEIKHYKDLKKEIG